MPVFTAAAGCAGARVHETPINGPRLACKRIFDLAAASIFLALGAPLIAVLAFLVKLQDGGPAFYRRRVVGRDGEFDACKLRTMCLDADAVLSRDPDLRRQFQVRFKLKDDPRVTPLGRFLRRSSLDELPQLWNVVRGQMSLVGPRIISPAELAKYGEAAWIFDRVRPGLSGYWQVNASLDCTYPERVAMDLHYVRHWSLGFDLKILLLTPFRVLRGSGTH